MGIPTRFTMGPDVGGANVRSHQTSEGANYMVVCMGRLESWKLGVYVLPHWDFIKPGGRDSEYHWSFVCGRFGVVVTEKMGV